MIDGPMPSVSAWVPVTDLRMLARLGKLNEELAELSAIVARCIIQGVEECNPETGKLNRLALEQEIADVLAGIKIIVEDLRLDSLKIAERCQHKVDHLRRWHAKL